MKFKNRNVHYLRVFQELLVISIIVLEAIQVIGYGAWFYDEPSHGSAPYYWIVLFLSFVALLYFLSNFSYIWKNGPYMYEIYFDVILTLLWMIVSFSNISSALTGGSLKCDYPEEEDHDVRIKRCHLFLSSISLGWVVVPTYMISSFISIMRWRYRPIEAMPSKFVDPPVATQKSDTYLVQKGVLSDGQPVLLFHMAQKK